MRKLYVEKLHGDIDDAYKKLQEVFPPEEIIPLNSMKTAYNVGKYHVRLLYDGVVLLGYAFLCDAGDNAMLFDYIFIDENQRGSGLGHYPQRVGRAGLIPPIIIIIQSLYANNPGCRSVRLSDT